MGSSLAGMSRATRRRLVRLERKGPCQNNLTINADEIRLSAHENRRANQRAVSINPWFAR